METCAWMRCGLAIMRVYCSNAGIKFSDVTCPDDDDNARDWIPDQMSVDVRPLPLTHSLPTTRSHTVMPIDSRTMTSLRLLGKKERNKPRAPIYRTCARAAFKDKARCAASPYRGGPECTRELPRAGSVHAREKVVYPRSMYESEVSNARVILRRHRVPRHRGGRGSGCGGSGGRLGLVRAHERGGAGDDGGAVRGPEALHHLRGAAHGVVLRRRWRRLRGVDVRRRGVDDERGEAAQLRDRVLVRVPAQAAERGVDLVLVLREQRAQLGCVDEGGALASRQREVEQEERLEEVVQRDPASASRVSVQYRRRMGARGIPGDQPFGDVLDADNDAYDAPVARCQHCARHERTDGPIHQPPLEFLLICRPAAERLVRCVGRVEERRRRAAGA